MLWFDSLYKHEEKNSLVFAGIVEDVGMSVEGESHPKDLERNEEGNFRDSEIWINLNESRNDNPSELLQFVKYLKAELKRVEEDNGWILKAREELNNVLLTKLHSNEKEKSKGPELNMRRTIPYKQVKKTRIF